MIFEAEKIDMKDDYMVYYRVRIGKWQHEIAIQKNIHNRMSKDEIKEVILNNIIDHSNVIIKET